MSPPSPRQPSQPLSRATPKERTSSRLLRWSFGPPVGQCARRTSKSRTAPLPAHSQAVYSGDIIAGKESTPGLDESASPSNHHHHHQTGLSSWSQPREEVWTLWRPSSSE